MDSPSVWSGMAALLLAWGGGAFAAQPAADKSAPQPAREPEQQELLEELDQVVVNGERPLKDDQQVINWLASLAGEFTMEGDVDVQGKGDPDDLQPVEGSASCVAFGIAPGVRCELHVLWPETRHRDGKPILGGTSTLDPAVLLYGFDPHSSGIRSMLVDNQGTGDLAQGLIFGNTLKSKSRCLNVPGNCQRVVRTTVEPDIQVIRMQIDLEIDSKTAVRYGFVMRRVPGSKATVIKGTSP